MWTVPQPIEFEAVNESELLVGHITQGGCDWTCRAAGGSDGISLGDPDGLLHLSVLGSDGITLPVAGEHYVKSDQWKIEFPQVTGEFSLRLSVRSVVATAERWVLEPTFSIQTSLLDTHPTLDLAAVGGTVSQLEITESNSGETVSVSKIQFSGGSGQLLVMLGPHDAPFTTNRSTDDRIELELFGEFLEKGVIRKARPWVILDRSTAGISPEELARYATQLCETPLPLTF